MSDQSPCLLEGIRVLDVASYIAAPIASTMMADFGAEVIKIEPPNGDTYRYINDNPGMPTDAGDFHWHLNNRNKKSICLDLTNDAGQTVLRRLVEQSDVFVSNFVKPVRDKLKISWDDLKTLNQRLIYASLTAYGEVGPEAAKTGFDSTAYWARSGLMHMVRPDPDQGPARSLPGQGDHPTGVALFGAIMLALYERERTGKGSKVHTSLLANGLWATGFFAQAVIAGGTVMMRPRREDMPNALTNHYQCQDQKWFLLTILNQEREWESLLKAIDKPELAQDQRFNSRATRALNAQALTQILDEVFITQPWAYWQTRFAEYRLTLGVVNTLDDLAKDPQILASEALVKVNDERIGADLIINSPVWVEDYEKPEPLAAPVLGEHTEQVLSNSGFSEAEVQSLKNAGAFG